MNIFVAFFLLLLLLADSTPSASTRVPYIGFYYCLNMCLITLSTFLSVIVINLYFRGDKQTRIPSWLGKTVRVLAFLLCMQQEMTSKSDKEKVDIIKSEIKNNRKHQEKRDGQPVRGKSNTGKTSSPGGPNSPLVQPTTPQRTKKNKGDRNKHHDLEMEEGGFVGNGILTSPLCHAGAPPVAGGVPGGNSCSASGPHYVLQNGQLVMYPGQPQGHFTAGQNSSYCYFNNNAAFSMANCTPHHYPQYHQCHPLHSGLPGTQVGGPNCPCGVSHPAQASTPVGSSEHQCTYPASAPSVAYQCPYHPVYTGHQCPNQAFYACQALGTDVREVRRAIRTLMYRISTKDNANRIHKEWRMVALVLDRIFFWCYLFIIIVMGLALLLPKEPAKTIAQVIAEHTPQRKNATTTVEPPVTDKPSN